MNAVEARRLRAWIFLLVAVGLAVIVVTHDDYGISWDESVQSRYGELVLDYFATGLEDQAANEYTDTRTYGPLFELAAAIAYRPFPERKWEIRHLLTALAGLLTALGLVRIGSLLRDVQVAVLAPLALLMMPRFYGHAFINSKDVPFACMFTWAIYALLLLALGERSRSRILACGLAFGGVLAVRPGGLPILLLLYLLVASYSALGRRDWAAWLRPTAVVWVVAWIGMILFWPWAHQNPLLHPLRAVQVALGFPAAYSVLFEGTRVWSDELPRRYALELVSIVTPPAVLALALCGLAAIVRAQLRDATHRLAVVGFAIQAWLVAPIALVTVFRSNVYDGIRHLLFVLPALALLAAIGAAEILHAVRHAGLRKVVAATLAIVLLLPVASLMTLHPYQMTYFNGFVGGVRGAQGRYETDYWVSSYREAIEWINTRAAAQPGRELRVLVAANHHSRLAAEHYVAAGVRMETTSSDRRFGEIPPPFDYYVATTRFGYDRNFPASPIAHEVGRNGAVFTVIRARTHALPPVVER